MKMKNTIERKTFEQRGQLQEYIDEETQYCGETLQTKTHTMYIHKHNILKQRL